MPRSPSAAGSPIIDPDLIGPADMVNPVTGDPAFSLWTGAPPRLSGLVRRPVPAGQPRQPGRVCSCRDRPDQRGPGRPRHPGGPGTDITARLAQLTLTYAAFTQLTTVIGLIAGGITPLDSEIQAVR